MKFISLLLVLVVVFVVVVHCVPVPQEFPENENPEVVCRQQMKRGQCRALIPRWVYDFHTGECLEFKYGGCGGNNNNFRSKQECEAKCLGVR